MTDPDAIRCCLRALADAQVTHFLPLLYKVNARPSRSTPRLDLKVYGSDRGKDAAYLVLSVEVFREDNIGITWSVRLDALPDRVGVSGGVERDDDDDVHEVFVRSESAVTATEAADAIARIAAQVCEQVSYIESST